MLFRLNMLMCLSSLGPMVLVEIHFTECTWGFLSFERCLSTKRCVIHDFLFVVWSEHWSKDVNVVKPKTFLLLSLLIAFCWNDSVPLWRGVHDKEGCLFCAAWEGTGSVNLALWRVTMTGGFTGHKPRGMRECRKWATVSIFCETALLLASSSSLPLCRCL